MAPSRGGAVPGRLGFRQGLPPLALRLLVLLSPLVVAFHDDDCVLAARSPGAAVDWVALRGALESSEDGAALVLAAPLKVSAALREECELGTAAVCLLLVAAPDEASRCVEGLSLTRVLASRWPLLRLLAGIQRELGGDAGSCDDIEHPSLDWREIRQRVAAFVEGVPPWLAGAPGGNSDAFNGAVLEALGVVWKASSAAVAYGRRISQWTGLCSQGVLACYAIQAAARLISNGDLYRIVERAIDFAAPVFADVGSSLRMAWPLFGVLHVLSVMKLAQHDTQFSPVDLSPLRGADEAHRSATWRSAAERLRRAAAAGGGAVLMTALPAHRVNLLMNFLKRADRLGFLEPLVIVPGRENVSDVCDTISEVFALARDPKLKGWSPCLPFVSMFAPRAQYLYIHVALQLGLEVLWFDFHVVWLRSPLAWSRRVLRDGSAPLPYHQDCRRDSCPSGLAPEVFFADEFYQRHWPRNSLSLLRPTDAVKAWIEVFARWLCTYPYANVELGLHYMVHPDEPDAVPGISQLPVSRDMPRVRMALLDTEQELATFDGWFGEPAGVVAIEVGGFIQEDDRASLLDQMLVGKPEDVERLLKHTKKTISPLRPTQRLYDRFAIQGAGVAPEPCDWRVVPDTYIGGFAAGVTTVFPEAVAARCECLALGKECAGVTCEPDGQGGESCTLRGGDPPLASSPSGEASHVRLCPGRGCDAPPVLRVVHVNFADGCCEAEQKQSSETAVQFGAGESRPLRGDFLDEDFKKRNHHLLTFNRTPELTQHKTPSGKIGYYVWKPYVVLRTVMDPDLPWDTTVVVWTDAGIHFVGDVAPLIERYMRISDVAATRTPMCEADFSKRDAFLLLDADYRTIMESNQIATGIILVRKTPLAVQFLEGWLKACEDPRIMTEEPSVLGMPDHPSYRNNNDDQTAFSLLFKKYGFEAFSVSERDAVVYTGRNLAKFIKASDDFAVGRETGQEAYLQAADEAAKQRSAA